MRLNSGLNAGNSTNLNLGREPIQNLLYTLVVFLRSSVAMKDPATKTVTVFHGIILKSVKYHFLSILEEKLDEN